MLGLVLELKKVDSTCYLKCCLMGPLSPHLKQGIESIDQIASLCQSDLEAVRTAAREATLSFGKVQHQTLCAIQWGSRRPLEGCARGATVSPQRCKTIQRPSA